jgi:hypothetical protein
MNLYNNNRIIDFSDLIIIPIFFFILIFFGNYLDKGLLIILLPIMLIFTFFVKKSTGFLLLIVYSLSNGFVGREYNMGGLFGVQQISAVVGLLFFVSRTNLPNGINYIKKRFNLVKFPLYFLIFLALYTNVKNYYFGIFNVTMSTVFFRFVNIYILNITLILVLKKYINSPDFWRRAVNFCFVFFALSTFFSENLANSGFYTTAEESEFESVKRLYGFYGNGDSNKMAGVAAIFIGYLLHKAEISNLSSFNSIFIIILGVLGFAVIGIAASRTALISVLAISAFFLIRLLFSSNSKGKNVFLFILIMLFSIPFLGFVLNRLITQSEDQVYEVEDTSNRIGKWAYYLNYFSENPITYLIGAKDELGVGWDNKFHVAHNLFVQLVYNGGIFFLIGFLIWIIHLIKFGLRSGHGFFYISLPFLLCIMTVSDIGVLYFFLIATIAFLSENSP